MQGKKDNNGVEKKDILYYLYVHFHTKKKDIATCGKKQCLTVYLIFAVAA